MTSKGRKCNRIGRRLVAIVCGFLLFALAVLGVLQMGAIYAGNAWSRVSPTYERVEISHLLTQSELSKEEYELLYRQTGLTKLAIDDMRTTGGGRGRILSIQDAFFGEFTTERDPFAPFTYTDIIDGRNYFCDLQEGDIIVTSTTSVSWWRYGHASIVVEGGTHDTAKIAESIAPGMDSELAYVDVYDYLADFLVYRPKAAREVKREIANYVQEEMLGLPYSFTVGILSQKNPKKLKATQCAHFVWYAYKRYGIDLDSNGGVLVKPQDMANSPHVELVQAFGFDLDRLWSK